MKKFIFFLITSLMPFIVLAVSPAYHVNGYFGDMRINSDGSVTVREAFILEGSFNGYERIIKVANSNIGSNETINLEGDSIYNPEQIDDLKVAAFKTTTENRSILDSVEAYSEYNSNSEVGDKDVYTLENDSDGTAHVRSYYSCSDCEVAFYYEFTLKDVVVLHNDVAEVYYQLFSAQDVTEDLNKIDLKVNFPEDDNDALMWVHGNVYGSVTRNDEHSFLIECDNFTEGSMLDFRTVFNKESVDSNLLKQSGIEALSQIKEIEAERDRVRQEEIEQIKQTIKTLKVLNALYAIGFVIIMIIVYIKYDKEYKVDFDAQYYRDFIEDYDVEVVEYLMKKDISANAMSASIMNMIYRKNIEAEPIDEKKKNYKFTLVSRNDLSENENKLVDFLFETVGDGTSYTTKKLQSYARSSVTYEEFNASYNGWCSAVKKAAQEQNFYLNLLSVKIKTAIYIFLGFLLLWVNFDVRDDLDIFLVIGAFIVLVVAAIYVVSFSKKTEKGALEYRKWTAFKNFLNDFGTFEIKELPEITLWEKYLVYATVFGLAKKVQKVMNVKIQEMGPAVYNGTDTYLYLGDFGAINEVVSSSISNAHQLAVSEAAASNVSNSGGTGGGFSSGGGFGGGGGGGHGF